MSCIKSISDPIIHISNAFRTERLAAIAAEVKQQKATLAKQREEYVKKSATLQRELEILRQQCDEIGKEGGRENNRIIKENQKLQVKKIESC